MYEVTREVAFGFGHQLLHNPGERSRLHVEWKCWATGFPVVEVRLQEVAGRVASYRPDRV